MPINKFRAAQPCRATPSASWRRTCPRCCPVCWPTCAAAHERRRRRRRPPLGVGRDRYRGHRAQRRHRVFDRFAGRGVGRGQGKRLWARRGPRGAGRAARRGHRPVRRVGRRGAAAAIGRGRWTGAGAQRAAAGPTARGGVGRADDDGGVEGRHRSGRRRVGRCSGRRAPEGRHRHAPRGSRADRCRRARLNWCCRWAFDSRVCSPTWPSPTRPTTRSPHSNSIGSTRSLPTFARLASTQGWCTPRTRPVRWRIRRARRDLVRVGIAIVRHLAGCRHRPARLRRCGLPCRCTRGSPPSAGSRPASASRTD